ncbi:MAG: hypothetical protein ABDI20_05310 [Candidatus Bipolaricaulaceae bacterium]
MWLMDMVFPVEMGEGEEPHGLLLVGDWEGVRLSDLLVENITDEILARIRDPRKSRIVVAEAVVKLGREAVLSVIAHELGHLLLRLYRVEGQGNWEEAVVEQGALFVLGQGPMPEALADCVRRQNRPPEAFRTWAERHLQWFEEAYGPVPPMEPAAFQKMLWEKQRYIRLHTEIAQGEAGG